MSRLPRRPQAPCCAIKVGLDVVSVLSGPQGGDAQIAAMVAEGRIRAVIFFVDPLSAHPHDPDIQTVMRMHGRSGPP